MKTERSRKQLLEGKILKKWDGTPLISEYCNCILGIVCMLARRWIDSRSHQSHSHNILMCLSELTIGFEKDANGAILVKTGNKPKQRGKKKAKKESGDSEEVEGKQEATSPDPPLANKKKKGRGSRRQQARPM